LNTTTAPLFLVIETSGRVGAVALAHGPELLCVQHLDETRRHARDLAPVAAALLKELGRVPRDLSGVIVGLGPGSYTGLRVGVMSAKALSYATGCALIGVSTFAAIARQVPDHLSRLDVLADAQQDKIYAQSFAYVAGSWQEQSPLAVVSFASWLASRPGNAWATGPGLHRWRTQVPDAERLAAEAAWDPQPASLLAVGLARFVAGKRDDVYTVEPLYLRPSSAEEQWTRRQQPTSAES
jgi:tRNA threonylcarbamoyladenosine biosynthesis protein TsaB